MVISKYREICTNIMKLIMMKWKSYPSPTSRDIITINPTITPREDNLPFPLETEYHIAVTK